MKKIDWNQLYSEQAPILKGVCRRYVPNMQLADDLVQNTFEIAINKIGTFQGKGSINGWLRRIAINACLHYLREKKTEKTRQAEYEASLLSERITDTEMNESRKDKAFSKEELLQVIDNLPEQHRIVFNMYVLDGYKHAEIAEHLNISVGTSKSNLSRARKQAKEALMHRSKLEATPVRRKSWVLLLLLRFNFIDGVFRKGLSAYVLPIQTIPVTISTAANTAVPVVGAVVSNAIVWTVSAIAITGGVWFGVNQIKHKNRSLSEYHSIDISMQYMQSKPCCIAVIAPKLELVKIKTKVIVKKQKVIKRTVYVAR